MMSKSTVCAAQVSASETRSRRSLPWILVATIAWWLCLASWAVAGEGLGQADAVKLGSGELTQGIPGEGPLTLPEIQKWLANEKNHVKLDVELPLGLDKAKNSLYIPEDNPLTRAKIELGRQLYFDRRLSSDSTVSCADCHHPDEGYTRQTQFGEGIEGQTGNRNSPVSYNRIVSRAQFWDGRANSLEAQAIGPIANPIEMGNTHEAAVAMLKTKPGYVAQFEKIFGDGVTIENVGKAIAAFERVVVTGPAPYDYYEPLRAFKEQFANLLTEEEFEYFEEDYPDLFEEYQSLVKMSDTQPLSESAKRGADLFFSERVNCAKCHSGANFADEKYHNLGVGMDQEEPDVGRYEQTKDMQDYGAFKTPTLRNVALTAPYMHDGSQETLEEVVEWYNKGGHANAHLSADMKPLNLTDQEKADLVAFMEALTGEFTPVETGRLPQ